MSKIPKKSTFDFSEEDRCNDDCRDDNKNENNQRDNACNDFPRKINLISRSND